MRCRLMLMNGGGKHTSRLTLRPLLLKMCLCYCGTGSMCFAGCFVFFCWFYCIFLCCCLILLTQSQSLSRRTAPFVPRVQVKLWYDKVGHQLIVTILGAKDLPSREDGRPRNPYVKIYFLPDRSATLKTWKLLPIRLDGEDHTMLFLLPIRLDGEDHTMLFLLPIRLDGEDHTMLFLLPIRLDGEDHTMLFTSHPTSCLTLAIYYREEDRPWSKLTSILLFSPFSISPPGSQRISDSEISDYDCEDGVGVVSDYRQNGRDLHSSTLSVPEQAMSSNHCSRSADMNRARSRSPSVPPPQSRSLDPGYDIDPASSQYSSSSRVDRRSVSDDHHSPDR
ncbi:unnamed protein product [Oncorhynchus mykiss]|uniref:C2 domain-containing protein n=1 Tax=Oncorhynchus mykiss TaxID=8022 RepID=A0A060Y9B9_ONCMY|nr:unnamed protein product [Oncorhynchus mykiss]